MNTSIVLLALSSLASAFDAVPSPSWNRDYASARKQAQSEKKPVVVVISSGEKGWEKLSHAGRLAEDAKQILADRYVCVYVDKATDEGKRLARDFEIAEQVGIVISDRTGGLQAFRHEGDLANPDLTRYLKRFANPDRIVVETETNPAEPTRSQSGFSTPVTIPSNCPT